MLTRDEFKMLARLLSRLASNADSALKLAEHAKATLKFQQDQQASAMNPPVSRKKRPATRRHNR
jgi:hypothetical protein